jgi:hypothetical protein
MDAPSDDLSTDVGPWTWDVEWPPDVGRDVYFPDEGTDGSAEGDVIFPGDATDREAPPIDMRFPDEGSDMSRPPIDVGFPDEGSDTRPVQDGDVGDAPDDGGGQ